MVEFDLRDPGSYTLQAMVTAFFGSSQPPELPLPINVGTHTTEFSTCHLRRALVSGGAVIGVELSESLVPKGTQLFGKKKCSSSDHKGRWVDLNAVGRACKEPYCTGDSENMLFDYDWVRVSLVFD